MNAGVLHAPVADRTEVDLEAEFEPTPAWIAATLGIGAEDADWLFVLYVAQRADTLAGGHSRRRYYCEVV